MRIKSHKKSEEFKPPHIEEEEDKGIKNIEKFLNPQDDGLFLEGEMKSPNFIKNKKGWMIDENGKIFAFGGNVVLYDAVVDSSGKGQFKKIQDALDAGFKRIFVRAGTYTINSTIEIFDNNVAIYGEDWSSTILKAKDNLNNSVIVVGDGTNSISNITISNIQIDGNKANQTGGTNRVGIRIEEVISHLKIEKCYIHDCKSAGIYGRYGSASIVFSKGSIIGCIINNNDVNGGINLGKAENIIIKGNFIYDNDDAYGIEIRDTSNNIIVSNNFVYSNGHGIDMDGNHCTAVNNKVFNNDGMGIYVGSSYNIVNNNNVKNNNQNSSATHKGEIVQAGTTNTINGNTIYMAVDGKSDYGIYLKGNQGYSTVVGNSLRHGASNNDYGIYVADEVTSCVIVGNVMRLFNDGLYVHAGATGCQVANNIE